MMNITAFIHAAKSGNLQEINRLVENLGPIGIEEMIHAKNYVSFRWATLNMAILKSWNDS